MSGGIPIHSQDPISPAKANAPSGSTPQTAYRPDSTPKGSSQSATTSSPLSQDYPRARPAAAFPTPTIAAPTTKKGPPPPQPGAVPAPHAITTARAGLPPPPRFDERPQPPDAYAPTYPTSGLTQPYPPQMSQPPLSPGPMGLPPASTTAISTTPAFQPAQPPTSLPISAETSARTSLEHPPGYVQNPYASDMTPDQRFATEQQENAPRTERLPSLGYNDNSGRPSNSPSEESPSVLEMAIKWGRRTGEQLGDWHEQVWDSIGRK